MDFDISVTGEDELRLAGDFDLAGRERFDEATRAAVDGQRQIVLDLSDLRFIDSSGLRAILELATALNDKGIVLRRPQARVRAVIDLVGIEGRHGIRIEA